MLLELFWSFFKIGLFTFGGGYAMIPLIEAEIIKKKNWISEEEMEEMLALSEVTPGPIAINLATLIGYKKRGIFGSVITTFGVCLPSFLIILLLSSFIFDFWQNAYVIKAFKGIRAGVSVLVLSAGIRMFKKTKAGFGWALSLAAAALSFFFGFSTVAIIILGAAVGISSGLLVRRREKDDLH